MSVTFREARRDDIPFLTGCAQAAYSQYVEAIGKRPAPMDFDFAGRLGHDRIEIVEDGEGPVGYLVWHMTPDSLFLESIALDPTAQGRGLARRALAHLEAQARVAGCAAITLYTNARMAGNLTLYPHLGFDVTGRRTENGFDRVYFRKDLTP